MSKLVVLALLAFTALAACRQPNEWVIEDPPTTCAAMCDAWGMELGAIVGVGKQTQDDSDGATSCVCQPKGTAATSASLAAAGEAAVPPEIRARARQAEAQRRRSRNLGAAGAHH